jgi:hypothetical protein
MLSASVSDSENERADITGLCARPAASSDQCSCRR